MNAMNYVSGLVLLLFAGAIENRLFNAVGYHAYSELFVIIGLILLAVGVLSFLGLTERVIGSVGAKSDQTSDQSKD